MEGCLKNKIFITTRPENRSIEMTELFRSEGATILNMPLIEIQPAILAPNEKLILHNLEQFNWLIFTSANGVKYFFRNNISALPENIKIAVIGKKTNAELNKHGYIPTFVNPGTTGEDFAEAFSQHLISEKKQQKVLLLLGNLARTIIQDKLKNIAECIRINVYKTVSPQKIQPEVLQQIKNSTYEMLLFTSPSGIENFLQLAPDIQPQNLRIACIGKTTAQAALENKIVPKVVAKESTSEGLFNSIKNYYIIKQKKIQL